MAISTPMLVTFCVYIFGMILIGFIAWRSTKNFDDYILGGRSLGPFVTALSAGASDMSGWLLMGLPGAIFLSGISESWIAIGLTLGAWINWKLVAGACACIPNLTITRSRCRTILPVGLRIRAESCVLFPRWSFCCFSLSIAHQVLSLGHDCSKAPSV